MGHAAADVIVKLTCRLGVARLGKPDIVALTELEPFTHLVLHTVVLW
jgi:hypothetical protein